VSNDEFLARRALRIARAGEESRIRQRGLGHAIFYTVNYLAHLEAQGVRVVNGSRCFRHEISKALQLTNLEKLGLPFRRRG